MIELAIERLKECEYFRFVGTSADIESMMAGNHTPPAAHVMPLTESAGPNQFASHQVVEQEVQIRFGVIMVVRNVRDISGSENLMEIENARRHVKKSLVGWVPSSDYDPCIFRSGRVLGFKNGFLWWIDEFISGCIERNGDVNGQI